MSTKQLRMDIDTERHSKLKGLSALEGKKMRKVVEELIDRYVEERTSTLEK